MGVPELLERGAALDALRGALESSAQRNGSVALVSGEPGIGKTALVTRFTQEHADRARVLVGVCDDLATPRPLGAFRDLADSVSPPLAESLREGPASTTFHSLLLEELRAGPAPTVLVVEDVHWADQATIDAVTVVGRRAADLPVLLLLTYRSGEIHPGHPLHPAVDALQRAAVLQLELAPLSREAVTALAGEDADRIFELSAGNPFFVTELIAHGDHPSPPSLANAVLGRVARLEASSRELLELVSMVPGRVATTVLDAVEPGWPGAAEEPERAQLLTGDAGHVRFRHELTRAAIRSSVPPSRRRLLHRRILEALQAVDADAADLVHHAEAAGATDVVGEHALAAARQAEAAGSIREAFAHFRRAADFTDRLTPLEQAGLWEGLAWTAYVAGHGAEAMAAASRAITLNERHGQRTAAGRCAGLRAHLHWFNGDGEAAWGDACAAIRNLEPAGRSLELARAYAQTSELAMLSSRLEEAVRWGRRALDLAGNEQHVTTRALASIGAARMQLDPEDTGPLLRALDVGHACGEHHHAVLALTALSYVNLQWVRPDQARSQAELGRAYAQAHEVDMLVAYLDAILAWLHLRAGDLAEAERLAGTVLATGPPAPGSIVGLQARTVLAELAVRRGDDDADDRLADLAADVDRTGELKRIGPVLELQVEHALTRGEPMPLARFEEVSRIVGTAPLREGGAGARVAAWAVLCGRRAAFAGKAPAPHAAMMRGDWSAAADAFGTVGWCHDRALMLSLLDSQDALTEAVGVARALGAAPLEQRVCRRMRELDLPVPRGPLASTRSNPAQLTDRQLEVLALVREGLGNADIAERLTLSPRTVEHHVASILARLGASSRAEAVARCADLGLA